MTSANRDFFIGWSRSLSKPQVRFLALTSAVIISAFAVLAVLLSLSITDPSRSLFGAEAVPDLPREVTLQGIVASDPYPRLAIKPNTTYPVGHSVMLVGEGKQSAAYDHILVEGRTVEVGGYLLKRGALDMMVVTTQLKLITAEPAAPLARPVPLGRWRVVGEICDGKCGAGIMSPGTGLAHKACANLCIVSGVPPVLVATHPLAGHRYFMIADEHGRAFGSDLTRFVGMRVEIVGDVELFGDAAMLRFGLASIRRL